MPTDGKPLLILGDGRCVWEDVERLGCAKAGRNGTLDFDGAIMCVNMIGLFVERFDYWYSNDGKWLLKLAQARRPEWAKMFPGGIELHTIMPVNGCAVWPLSGPGSSSLNAARIGVAMGHDPVTLCGVPLDDSGHNGDPPWKTTNFTREVASQVDCPENRAWKSARLAEFNGKVRSMSGRTKDWLG